MPPAWGAGNDRLADSRQRDQPPGQEGGARRKRSARLDGRVCRGSLGGHEGHERQHDRVRGHWLSDIKDLHRHPARRESLLLSGPREGTSNVEEDRGQTARSRAITRPRLRPVALLSVLQGEALSRQGPRCRGPVLLDGMGPWLLQVVAWGSSSTGTTFPILKRRSS